MSQLEQNTIDLENILEEVNELPEAGGTSIDVTANWNANEGEEGYILNRTHYVDENGVIHKLDNKFIDADWMATSVENGGDQHFYANIEFSNTTAFLSNYGGGFKVDPGFVFDVYWGGVKYVLPLKDRNGEPYIGNAKLGLNGEDTGEPFCLYGSFLAPNTIAYVKKNTATAETVEVRVVTHVETVYNKLPEEFLPDGVAMKSDIPDVSGSIDVTAEVGQTIIVKEVDENGKPTKWESADYQPRTHWVEKDDSPIVPETAIAIGSDNMYMNNGMFTLAEGGTYAVIWDGVEYICDAVVGSYMGAPMVYIGNAAYFGGENNDMPFVAGMLTSGQMAGINAIAAFVPNSNHTFSLYSTLVHKIPERYVPSSDRFVVHLSGIDGTSCAEDITDIVLAYNLGKTLVCEWNVSYGNVSQIVTLPLSNAIAVPDENVYGFYFGPSAFSAGPIADSNDVYVELASAMVGIENGQTSSAVYRTTSAT